MGRLGLDPRMDGRLAELSRAAFLTQSRACLYCFRCLNWFLPLFTHSVVVAVAYPPSIVLQFTIFFLIYSLVRGSKIVVTTETGWPGSAHANVIS